MSPQSFQDINIPFNTPGKPSFQISRKSIDFGDKIRSESFFVCVSFIQHMTFGSSPLDSANLSFFSCEERRKRVRVVSIERLGVISIMHGARPSVNHSHFD